MEPAFCHFLCTMRFIFLAFLFLAFGCSSDSEKPLGPYAPPEYGPFAMSAFLEPNARPAAAAPASAEPSTSSGPSALSGILRVSRAIQAKLGGEAKVVFVIARPAAGGPPLAVKKMLVQRFPMAFTLSDADAMTPGAKLTDQLSIVARIDADGSAGPAAPGDFEGRTSEPVAAGATNLDILIDQAR